MTDCQGAWQEAGAWVSKEGACRITVYRCGGCDDWNVIGHDDASGEQYAEHADREASFLSVLVAAIRHFGRDRQG